VEEDFLFWANELRLCVATLLLVAALPPSLRCCCGRRRRCCSVLSLVFLVVGALLEGDVKRSIFFISH
jgi:hypothetical protein